jgi:hypothetical protein
MIPRFLQCFKTPTPGLLASRLFDERTFYRAFMRDLSNCQSEAVIESPFITTNRVGSLLPIFKKMGSRQVRIVVNTRHPAEHEVPYDIQAWRAIQQMQAMGVEVLFTGGHHRKLAILDRRILWEGSLNVLSQNDSCEIMRRVESEMVAQQMIEFTRLNRSLQ